MADASVERASLVTGGAGFIGSHLVEALVRRGKRVVVIDDLSTGRMENLAGVDPSRVYVHRTTVTDGLSAYCPGDFDQIYHLAAAVGVRLVIAEPVHTIETNIGETSAVLEHAAQAKTPTLIASTSEVYGKSTRTPFAEDDDVVYGATTLSRWSYAASKAIDEYLALARSRTDGLPAVIARFFNTVGPRQVGHYGMVLPRFVEAALLGEPLQVYGDGEQSRCFCDVRDVVELLPAMLETTACHGRVFNVGTDEAISIAGLADLVRETLGSSSAIEFVSYDDAFGPGFDDLRHRIPDLTRIRAATGFQARITLRQTILDLAADLDRSGQPPTRENA
ncbi:MAG: NAD-dependent epimerase/dehydratase family protein [Planctomycetota bacterium]|jgi:UDP-glucose 4-epimerase